MKKSAKNIVLVALLVGVAGFTTPSRAETGRVEVVFTKGGFVVGVGGGEGVLTLRGRCGWGWSRSIAKCQWRHLAAQWPKGRR